RRATVRIARLSLPGLVDRRADPARACDRRGGLCNVMRDALPLAIGAIVAATLLHYVLSRASRRLPRRIARRRGLPLGREIAVPARDRVWHACARGGALARGACVCQ